MPREELIGGKLGRFLAPEEASTLDAEWRRLWTTNDWHGVRTFVRADGTRQRAEYAARTARIDRRPVALVVFREPQPEAEWVARQRLGELTAREREGVSLVALGHSSPEIAKRLMISHSTVNTHVKNAMAKTGAKTRTHLVAIVLADRRLWTPE